MHVYGVSSGAGLNFCWNRGAPIKLRNLAGWWLLDGNGRKLIMLHTNNI